MKKFLNYKFIPAVCGALLFTACNDSLDMSEFKDQLDTQIEVGVSLEDVEKPVLSKIRASNTREGAVSQTASTFVNGTFEQVLGQTGEEKFFAQPYHTNSVWVYVECSDDAGIEYISCTEQLLYTVEGIDVSSKTALSRESKLFSKRFLKGSGARSAVAEYIFDSNVPDGIVELSFTAVDYAGRRSDAVIKTACIKDTYVNGYAGVFQSMDIWRYEQQNDEWPSNWDEMDSWARHLYVNEPSSDKFAFYNGREYTGGCDNTLVDVYTGYTEDSLKPDVLNSEWTFVTSVTDGSRYSKKALEWDTGKDLYIKTVTRDVCGNTAYNINIIPAIPKLLSVVNDTANDRYVFNFERKVYECGRLTDSPSADYWYFYWNEDGEKSLGNRISYDDFWDYGTYTEIKNPDSSKTYTARLFTDDSCYIMSPVYKVSSALTDSGTDGNINNLFTYEKVSSKKNTGCLVLDFKFDKSRVASSGYEKFYVVAEYTEGEGADKVTDQVRTMIYDRTDLSVKTEVYLPADDDYTYSVKVYGIKDGLLYSSEEFNPSADKDTTPPSMGINISSEYAGTFTVNARDYPSGTIDNLVDEDGFYYINVSWTDIGGSKTKVIKANTEETYFSLDSLELVFGANGRCVTPCTLHFELSDKDGNTTTLDKSLSELRDIVYQYHFTTDTVNSNNAIISYTASNDQKLYNTKFEEFSSLNFEWTFKGNYGAEATLNNFYSVKDGYFIRLTGKNNSMLQEPQYFYAKRNLGPVYGFISSQSKDKVSFVSGTPVYVHTIYSAMDRGPSVREWERWCPDEQKINRKVYTSKTSDSYAIDDRDIPEGMYYRVVVHFADGTADISDVYRKEGQE